MADLPRRRLSELIRFLRGRRNAVIVAAMGLGLMAVLLDGVWAQVSAVGAILAATAAIAGLSLRLSQIHLGLRSERPRPQPVAVDPSESDTSDSETLRQLDLANSLAGLTQSRSIPLVTVVIACFNEERFITDAISSIASQSYPNLECIIVDDASTDDSLARISAATKDDDRFRVARHKVNSGLSATRNTGLRLANGELTTFLDADDFLLADSILDRVVSFLGSATDPHVVGSYCGVINVAESASPADYSARNKWGKAWMTFTSMDLVAARGECPFSAHAPLCRTETLRAVGGFDETFQIGGEDWDLWLRLMRGGHTFVPSTYRTAAYRQKRQSMIRANTADHALLSQRLIDAAFRNVEVSDIRAPSPTPLPLSIAEYDRDITQARRMIRFAATALTSGDEQSARRVLQEMPSLPEPLLNRHVEVDNQFLRGVKRGLAYTGSDNETINAASNELKGEFMRLLRETVSPPTPIPPRTQTRIDRLLVPQHRQQLRAMLHDTPPGTETAVLLLDRESGQQGVVDGLDDTQQVWSLNRLSFEQPIISTVVVGVTRSAIEEAVVRAALESGATVIEIPSELDSVKSLDEAPPHLRPNGEARVNASSLNGIDRFFDAFSWNDEEYPDTRFDADKLSLLREKHAGERVVIIGNGPSLNKLDLRLLSSEFTIAVNAIFLAGEKLGFDPSYYVVEDTAVVADNLSAIKSFPAGQKLFPSIYRDQIGEAPNITYFMMNRGFYSPSSPNYCIPRFATDVQQQIFCGQSVTIINLQLAYHLGFTEVVLIGMDFSYSIPADAEVDGNRITSRSDDPNHFHPDYFGPGKVWKDPKLDRVLANYALAKEVFEADGRRIVNATAGGNLELFERIEYESLFRSP